MEKFIKVKAVVIDNGDPSVGIDPFFWEIECPFYGDEDEDNKEFFRKEIQKLYKEFAEGKIHVFYSYEKID